jgi:hypothetical protein
MKNYFFCDPEHYGHKTRKRGSFSKLFLDFQFWTFLKMSIFDFGADFLFEICKEYILLIF